jgi:hypothetical protein
VRLDEKYHTEVMNNTTDALFNLRDGEAWEQITDKYITELNVRMLQTKRDLNFYTPKSFSDIENEQFQRRAQLADQQQQQLHFLPTQPNKPNVKQMAAINQMVAKENEKMAAWVGKKNKRGIDSYRLCQTVWLGGVDLLLAGYTAKDKFVTRNRRTYLYSLKDPCGEPPSYLENYDLHAFQQTQQKNGEYELQYKEAPADPRDERYLFMGRTEYIDRNLAAWYDLAKRPINSGTSMLITKQVEPNSYISIDPNSGQLVQIPCVISDQWRWLYNSETGTLYCPRIIFQYIKMIIHEFRIIHLLPSIKKVRDARPDRKSVV